MVAAYEDHATPPELRRVGPGGETTTIHAPAPRAITAAPYAALEEVVFSSFDGLEIPAFLMRPRGASAERPVPAVVYPHGGPTMCYADEWDGHAQYFIDQGYAWLALNFRGSTGYGREFERLNHGAQGTSDAKDCLAGADFLRTLDWVDGGRLAIFGASYGSHMALACVTDDPEHRFRCGVCKYGDCDLETSWAQGDREGVQDTERMMGTPATNGAAYRAGLALPPAGERRGAAADRARRAGRAGEPEAVRAAGGPAAGAGQDLRVRDLPHRGATGCCAPVPSSTSTGGLNVSLTGISCR